MESISDLHIFFFSTQFSHTESTLVYPDTQDIAHHWSSLGAGTARSIANLTWSHNIGRLEKREPMMRPLEDQEGDPWRKSQVIYSRLSSLASVRPAA